jgi:hypothetical protein
MAWGVFSRPQKAVLLLRSDVCFPEAEMRVLNQYDDLAGTEMDSTPLRPGLAFSISPIAEPNT